MALAASVRDNERLGLMLSQIQSELTSINRAGAGAGAGSTPTVHGQSLPLDSDDGYGAPTAARHSSGGGMGARQPSAQALQALLLETADGHSLPVSECDLEGMQGEWIDQVRVNLGSIRVK